MLAPVLTLASVALGVAIPYVMGVLIDRGISVGDMGQVMLWDVVMLAGAGMALVAGVLSGALGSEADQLIRRLPDGYQTQISGDGANLSAGRRQLLTMAGAAVAHPPSLILDEATSFHRHPHRAARSKGHERHHEGPHHLRDRTPALDRPRRRLHHRPGARPHHRTRHPRRANRRTQPPL